MWSRYQGVINDLDTFSSRQQDRQQSITETLAGQMTQFTDSPHWGLQNTNVSGQMNWCCEEIWLITMSGKANEGHCVQCKEEQALYIDWHMQFD